MSYKHNESPALLNARIAADQLRKDLKSDDVVTRVDAARRIAAVHPHYMGDERAILALDHLPLRHALHTIALEYGYVTWAQMKEDLDQPCHEYVVRVYMAGGVDRIGRYSVEAPNETIAECIGIAMQIADYGPGSYEAMCDLSFT